MGYKQTGSRHKWLIRGFAKRFAGQKDILEPLESESRGISPGSNFGVKFWGRISGLKFGVKFRGEIFGVKFFICQLLNYHPFSQKEENSKRTASTRIIGSGRLLAVQKLL